MKPMITKFKENYLFLLILLFSLFIVTINLNKPFVGHHDFNSVFFSSIARNLSRYSILQTKLGQVGDNGQIEFSKGISYYTHNVPFYAWFLAVDFWFFGVGEWQARILTAIYAMGNVALIYAVAKKLFSKTTALLAAFLFSTTAMFIYFSKAVFPDVQAIFFSLMAFYFYLLWIKEKRKEYFYFLMLSSILALGTVWSSFLFLLFLLAHYFFFIKEKEWTKFLILISIGPLVFLAYLLHVSMLTGSPVGGGIIESLLSRSSISGPRQGFTLIHFVRQEFSLLGAYYSKISLLLVFGFFLHFFSRFSKFKNLQSEFLLLVLFLWGISYPLVFSNASFIHDYFLIYLSPFIAIASAHFLISFYQALRTKISFLKKPLLVIIFLFPVLQLLSVSSFSRALLKTDASMPGFILGNKLSEVTKFSDKILVLSGQFGAHFGVFSDFYSDRRIDYRDMSLEDLKKSNFEKRYNYIVFVKDREETPKEVDEYLSSSYRNFETENFDIFEMVSKK